MKAQKVSFPDQNGDVVSSIDRLSSDIGCGPDAVLSTSSPVILNLPTDSWESSWAHSDGEGDEREASMAAREGPVGIRIQ